MHELSIVSSIVEAVTESALKANASRVTKVYLKLGALSGIAMEPLQSCYDFSTRDTMLEGSSLEIEVLPVIVHCSTCQEDRVLPDIRRFRCPVCDTPSADIRQGKELDIGSLEVELR
jgi:hydrogenase nickel incorporation protein HypA/HybF